MCHHLRLVIPIWCFSCRTAQCFVMSQGSPAAFPPVNGGVTTQTAVAKGRWKSPFWSVTSCPPGWNVIPILVSGLQMDWSVPGLPGDLFAWGRPEVERSVCIWSLEGRGAERASSTKLKAHSLLASQASLFSLQTLLSTQHCGASRGEE